MKNTSMHERCYHYLYNQRSHFTQHQSAVLADFYRTICQYYHLHKYVLIANPKRFNFFNFLLFSNILVKDGENFFNSSRPCHPCYPNVMKLFMVTFVDAKSLFSEF
jgi:hypothetical protein